MNFATHLLWLTVMWLTSWSVLLYYQRIFDEVIDMEIDRTINGEVGEGLLKRKRIQWERPTLRILFLLVFLWFLSSVIHYIFATWFSVNDRQFLWTVFQDGLNIDLYWRLGPNKAYIVRVWYTNLVHIILDFIILAFALIWIRRAQRQWSRKLTLIYVLLFLSGLL